MVCRCRPVDEGDPTFVRVWTTPAGLILCSDNRLVLICISLAIFQCHLKLHQEIRVRDKDMQEVLQCKRCLPDRCSSSALTRTSV